MSLCRPLHEDLNNLNEEVLGESGLPGLENKTCVGTVDNFPRGLSWADEYLGPGLWRLVARATDLSPYSSTALGTDGIPVMSDDRGLAVSLSGTPFLSMPYLIRHPKSQPALWDHRMKRAVGCWQVMSWLKECCPEPKCHQGCGQTSRMRTSQSQNSSQFCSAPARNEKSRISHPGLSTSLRVR